MMRMYCRKIVPVIIFAMIVTLFAPLAELSAAPKKSEKLEISPKVIVVSLNETKSIKVEWRDTRNKKSNVTNSAVYSVDKPELLSVDRNGKVKGLAPGRAYLTAKYRGLSSTAIVEVIAPPLASIEADAKSLSLFNDETHSIKITASYGRAKADVTKLMVYKSSDPSIASVTREGKVKALKQGTTEIVVSLLKYQLKIPVTVLGPKVVRIQAEPGSIQLEQGESAPVQVIAHYADSSQKVITNDPNLKLSFQSAGVAVMDGIQVRALSEGETMLSFQYMQLQTEMRIIVDKAGNLLNNASFENGSAPGTTPYDWLPYVEIGNGIIESTDQVVFKGKRALHLSGSDMDNNKAVMAYQVVPVQGDKVLDLSGFVNVTSLNNAKFQFYIDYYNSDLQWVGNVIEDFAHVSNGYENIKVRTITPKNTAYANVFVVLRATGNGGHGSVKADDLSLRVVEFTELSAAPITLEEGATTQASVQALSIDGSQADVTSIAQYESLDSSIATIQGSDVHAIRSGSVIIRATYEGVSIDIPVTVEGKKILKNGSFDETSTGELPSGWYPIISNSNMTARLADGLAHTSKSLELSGTNLSVNSTAMLYQVIQVTPNKSFEISGLVHADHLNQSRVEFYIDFYDSSFTWVGNSVASHNTTTDGFVPLKKSDIVPSGASYANVFVIMRAEADGASGHVYLDNLTFNYMNATAIRIEPQGIELNTGEIQSYSVYAQLMNGEQINVTSDAFVQADGVFSEVMGIGQIRGKAEGEGALTAAYDGISATIPVKVTAANHLRNPGFEMSSEIEPLGGWNSYISETANGLGSVQITPGAAYEGLSALHLSGNGLHSGSMLSAYQVLSVTGGSAFELSGQVKAEDLNNAKAELYIDYYDSSYNWVSNSISSITEPNSNYQKVEVTGIVPQTAAYANVFVVLRGTSVDGRGSVYFDSMNWKPITQTGLTVNKPSINMIVYESQNLEVTANFSNGFNLDVTQQATYTSANSVVAAVYGNTVVGNSVGVTNIDVQYGTMTTQVNVAVNSVSVSKNGGFEWNTGTSGIADQWQSYIEGSEGLISEFATVTGLSTEGLQSQKITAANMQAGRAIMVYQVVDVTSAAPFVYSGDLFIESLDKAKVQIYVDFYNSEFAWLGNYVQEMNQTTEGFTGLQIAGVTPENARFANIFLIIRANEDGASAIVYGDRFEFR